MAACALDGGQAPAVTSRGSRYAFFTHSLHIYSGGAPFLNFTEFSGIHRILRKRWIRGSLLERVKSIVERMKSIVERCGVQLIPQSSADLPELGVICGTRCRLLEYDGGPQCSQDIRGLLWIIWTVVEFPRNRGASRNDTE